ncbi:hypothetical protein [Pedobacter glucosidilyticus]|uniref:hypothetical protein n=1 Tax=Pedobacter glucosidilyticus TaxID=1122941 RepID=UPI00042010E7|nr:hypothetical protein [Pedobacter glucosidilyticus]
MKIGTLLLIMTLIIGCRHEKKHTKNNLIVKSQDSIMAKDEILDSLTNPYSYYYLSNQPIEYSAKLILTDSIYPSDNKITFDSMDSLSSENEKTRNFFFKVFIKILDKADGSLSEAVGSYVLQYIKRYPKEFLTRTDKIDKRYFNKFAHFAGYELGFSEDYGKDWLDSLTQQCLNCDSNEFKKLNNFKQVAQETINEVKGTSRHSNNS